MQFLGFIIFISIFLAICLAGNFYIVYRFLSFWNLKFTAGIWILILILSISYVASSMLDHRLPSFFSRMLLRISGLWLGIGFLCLVCLGAHDLLRLVFRFPIDHSRWIATGIILFLMGYSFLNAFRLEVKTIEIPAPVDMTVLQISDVHLGSVSKRHVK